MNRLCTLVTLTIILGLLHTSATAQQIAGIASVSRHELDTETDLLGVNETPVLKAQPWERTPDRITGHIDHSKLNNMKSRTEALVHLFQDSCFSAGDYTPVWHGEYFSGRSLTGSLLKFAAQCSFYGGEKNTDKKADLLILANDLTPLLGHLTVYNNAYLTITATITRRNGCFYFELPQAEAGEQATSSNGAPAGLTTSFWLVTTDSTRLPYMPVTRKEYLLEARKQLISDTDRISTEWRNKITIRPTTAQEAEKQQELEQLKALYTGTELEARTRTYLAGFLTDEAYLQANIRKATALQRATLHFVDSLLHTDAAELNRPAVIAPSDNTQTSGEQAAQPVDGNTPNADAGVDKAFAFHGFADGQPGATLLVKQNPTFFDPYLSEDKPQFFLVGWRYDSSDPLAADLNRQLHQNFNGQGVQEMLGK